MAFFYPRKQTLIIFLVCATAVGGVAYWVYGDQMAIIPSGKIEIVRAPLATPSPVIAASEDWKEQFVNAKTAKDITSSKSAEDVSSTLTSRFGRDFFMRYVGLQQTGQFSDTNVTDKNFENLIDGAMVAEKPFSYKLTDITEVPDSTPHVFETWKGGIVHALSLFTWTRNEGMIVRDSVDREDPSLLTKIDPIIQGYSDMLSVLKNTPTPASASLVMLDLMNSLGTLKFAAQSFRDTTKDPMKSMVAISAYLDGSHKLMLALEEAGQIFADKGDILQVNALVMDVPFRY